MSDWVLAFDHISSFPRHITDTLCRLSAGTAWHQAAPHDDYIPVQQARPILLTTTESCPIPAELAERAIFVRQADPTPESRRTEQALNAEFTALQPRVFYYLIKGILTAIRRQAETAVPPVAMPDAAHWMAAAVPGLHTREHPLAEAEIQPALAEANRPAPDPLISEIVTFVDARQNQKWRGTPTELWEQLPEPKSTPLSSVMSRRCAA